jgi:cell division FtsZ-interacting protein ZapD
MSSTPALSEADILAHAIETLDRTQRAQVCRSMSALKLPTEDLDRVDALLAKNRDGEITTAERAELDRFLRVGNFLALVRARASRELGRETTDAR